MAVYGNIISNNNISNLLESFELEYNNFNKILESCILLQENNIILESISFKDIKNKLIELWTKFKKWAKEVLNKISSKFRKEKIQNVSNLEKDVEKKNNANNEGNDEDIVLEYIYIEKNNRKINIFEYIDKYIDTYNKKEDLMAKIIDDFCSDSLSYDSIKQYEKMNDEITRSIDFGSPDIKCKEIIIKNNYESRQKYLSQSIKILSESKKYNDKLDSIEKNVNQMIQKIDNGFKKYTDSNNEESIEIIKNEFNSLIVPLKVIISDIQLLHKMVLTKLNSENKNLLTLNKYI